MDKDFDIPRLTDVDMVKQVQMITSTWAKSAQEGEHPSLTVPLEALHLFRAYWIKTDRENNSDTTSFD